MPFESKTQERYMWWKHPEIARRWEKVTPDSASLPEKKKEAKALTTSQPEHCNDEIEKRLTLGGIFK